MDTRPTFWRCRLKQSKDDCQSKIGIGHAYKRPDLSRFDRGQRLAVTGIDGDGLRLEASMHDPVRQKVKARMVSLTERGTRFYPLEARYCWPSELDLRARLAGLQLRDRWGGWNEEPFTAASTTHVSVYQRE